MEQLNYYNKRIELVKHWLYNYERGIKNEEILIIRSHATYNVHITDKSESARIKAKFKTFELEEWLKNRESDYEDNIILTVNKIPSISQIKSIQMKILYISTFEQYKEYSLYDFLYSLDKDKPTSKPNISNNESIIHYIYKHEPLEAIQKIQANCTWYLSDIFQFFERPSHTFSTLLIRNTNLPTNNDLIPYLLNDIEILKIKGILTSRLAISLYRRATFDLDANVTQIGLYYSKIFGKSKVVDLKNISKDTSVNYNGLSKTIVKAYDIYKKCKSEKEIRKELEIEIKQDIARKLFNFTDIDFDTVKKIVELPRTALEKLR